jgi:hypothetical protein
MLKEIIESMKNEAKSFVLSFNPMLPKEMENEIVKSLMGEDEPLFLNKNLKDDDSESLALIFESVEVSYEYDTETDEEYISEVECNNPLYIDSDGEKTKIKPADKDVKRLIDSYERDFFKENQFGGSDLLRFKEY